MTESSETAPFLVLELDGDRAQFRAYAQPNQWALMENAQATKSGNATEAMASTYRLAVSSVLPEDRERFSEWMLDHGHSEDMEDVLTEALLTLWDGKSRLPLEPTSSTLSSSTGETGSTSTDDSSEPESSPPPQAFRLASGSEEPEVDPTITYLLNGDQRVGSSIPA